MQSSNSNKIQGGLLSVLKVIVLQLVLVGTVYATPSVEIECNYAPGTELEGLCSIEVEGASSWSNTFTKSGKVTLATPNDEFSTWWWCNFSTMQTGVSVSTHVLIDGNFYYNSDGFLCPANESPILLDLDRNQFHLSGGPVSFDIDADGENELITWTKAGELDGFLYLDRNGNGIVDNGSELFGNRTPLMDGSIAPHGYAALAEYDLQDNGGFEDGVIDGADSIFTELRVWIDINADGQFEMHESMSMSEAGVIAIGLDFKELPREDSYGNHFLCNGRAWIEEDGHVKKIWTTDVFFQKVGQ